MRFLALAAASVVSFGCSAPLSTIGVVADRAAALANGNEAITITATTKAADGSPSEEFVDFTTSGGQLSAARVKADAAGLAKTILTSTTAGSVTVTAAMKGAIGSTTVTFVTPTSGPRLRFQASPSNTAIPNLLRPIPVVVVEDGSGVVLSSSASVTVAVTAGSCGVALDPSSLTTVTADRGTANFYGLKISTAATGCTLTATSGSLQTAVSAAFDIQ